MTSSLNLMGALSSVEVANYSTPTDQTKGDAAVVAYAATLPAGQMASTSSASTAAAIATNLTQVRAQSNVQNTDGSFSKQFYKESLHGKHDQKPTDKNSRN